MRPDGLPDEMPRFVLEEYFNGNMRAWGIFEDRFGRLRRQFTVSIEGRTEDDRLILDERFRFADGETDRRVWHITRTGERNYEGRADDVIGTARGEVHGNALNWRYEVDLKIRGRQIRVAFDDRMLLQPDGVLLNRARVSKWGFELGQVILVFMPADRVAIRPAAADGWPAGAAMLRAANQ